MDVTIEIMTEKTLDVKMVLDECREKVFPIVIAALCDLKYPEAFSIPKKYEIEAKEHWNMVREYPERKGKYIRPTMLVLSAQSMGEIDDNVYKLAAAMQLSEEWLLMHDDFEDGSTLRRGKPAMHRIVGNELAVNSGDAIHVAMWGMLYDAVEGMGKEAGGKIFREFNKMLTRTALGQAVEIGWMKKDRYDFDDDDWFFIADGKTSYYTIAGPMRLGALCAGADENQLEIIARFGMNLGRCFQLVDDILDVTGNFSGLKQVGGDIYEGKRTVILSHLLKNVEDDTKDKLIAILDKSRDQKTVDEVEWVMKKMKEKGSVVYAKTLAEKFAMEAVLIFDNEMGFVKEAEARKKLRLLIDFILQRDH